MILPEMEILAKVLYININGRNDFVTNLQQQWIR